MRVICYIQKSLNENFATCMNFACLKTWVSVCILVFQYIMGLLEENNYQTFLELSTLTCSNKSNNAPLTSTISTWSGWSGDVYFSKSYGWNKRLIKEIKDISGTEKSNQRNLIMSRLQYKKLLQLKIEKTALLYCKANNQKSIVYYISQDKHQFPTVQKQHTSVKK